MSKVPDSRLHSDILDELDWEAAIDSSKIGVTVSDGVITLTGNVPSYSQKLEAERVVKRVVGVHGVANDIEVKLAGTFSRNDTDIVQAALAALKWNSSVPDDRIRVTVRNGFVTLEGNVDWQYQREAAIDTVRYLSGVTGVSNQITITPKAKPAEVSAKIEAAFKRSAEVDASHVRVAADAGRVTLSGKVSSWTERGEAERAAWSAPGVCDVDNRLAVGV